MANQSTELVKLKQGMKYTTSDHFNRNIYRHLRFAHPTYIYGELSFEIDENGDPYWIAPVKKFNIGLFGGETVGKVVICNAVTGKTKTYDVGNVPQWVDRVYSADLLVNLFDYYGTLKHGFFNSVLSQKDCLETTDGYNYLALNDDVWMYTGVTSVNGDQSNVGFVSGKSTHNGDKILQSRRCDRIFSHVIGRRTGTEPEISRQHSHCLLNIAE